MVFPPKCLLKVLRDDAASTAMPLAKPRCRTGLSTAVAASGPKMDLCGVQPTFARDDYPFPTGTAEAPFAGSTTSELALSSPIR